MVTTTDQGLSYIQYEADGVAVNFMLTFPYLIQDHIHVYLDGVESFDFTWLNSSEITMDVAPAALALLTIKRLTQQDERIVDFQDGGVIREATLDLDSNQLFYLTQEAIDTTAFNLAIDSTTSIIDAQNNKIINVADGVDPQDAVTKSQLDAVQAIADAAVVTADAAVVTANGIAATAATALANANIAIADAEEAIDTANDASATANAIAAVADQAALDATAALALATTAAADVIDAQADADAALADNAQEGITAGVGTGIVDFDGLSINVVTSKFDVGAVDAWFVDNETVPMTPTRVRVSFPASMANLVTNLATHLVTYVGINSAGVIIQSTSPFTATQRRTIIALGQVIHSDHIVVNAINNNPTVSYGSTNQLEDLMEGMGPFNMSGNVVSANGANLSINKSAGLMFKRGSNYNTDPRNPHQPTLAILTAPSNMRYRTQTGTEGANVSVVDPTMYDLAGVATLIPAATRWSIQRVAIFQSNLVRIQYGQAHYATLADALGAIGTEAFSYEQNIRENAMIIGYIVVRRNATDLSNTATCVFVQAPKFAGGSAGGVGTVPTLQRAYDNSSSPEITTDSTLGAFSLKRGSAADTDDVFETQNGAGTKTLSITGEGIIVNAGIATPKRADVKQDTKANLDIYAATATNGQLCFATDTKTYYGVVDGVLRSTGGTTGGLETAFQLVGDENIADWSTGDNATFLGAGAISVGAFVKNTSTPIQGLASYKYTQPASTAVNEYMASPAQALDLRFRGRECTFSMSNKYSGATGDIEVIFYDATNSVVLPTSVFIQANTSLNRFATNVFVPATCTSIRVGFQTRVQNAGKIFEFDSIEFGLDSTVFANVTNILSSVNLTGSTVSSGSYLRAVAVEASTKSDYLSYFTISDDSTNGTRLYAKKAGLYTFNAVTIHATATLIEVILYAGKGGIEYMLDRSRENQTSANGYAGATGSIYLEVGDYLVASNGSSNGTVSLTYLRASLVASNTNILTVPDTFSTDTAPLVYAGSGTYTLATLANAPVGTFITYTTTISTTDTRVQTTTAPTQTTADMNTNGINIFTRVYAAASTAGNPGLVAIQIGKGMKGVSLSVYKSTGKVNAGNLDYSLFSANAVQVGAIYKDYNETTGILLVNTTAVQSASTNQSLLIFSDGTSQTNGYLVINASKNSALTGMNINAVAARGVNTAGTLITAETMVWNASKTYDTHNALDAATGIFTAPESGYYQASWAVTFVATTYAQGDKWFTYLYKQGAPYAIGMYNRVEGYQTVADIEASVGSCGVFLIKGETAHIHASNDKVGGVALYTGAGANHFSIHKINVG
jgi:hypothetical protein